VSDNRILRRIFYPKRNAVTGTGKNFHTEKLIIFCAVRNVIIVVIKRGLKMRGICNV